VDALRNTLDLARLTEALGFHRYWVAEHHGGPMLAGAAPEVLISAIASATTELRVGSGGVMLPHYSPFKVAETFTLLAALFPGRIDLGIGRAPGTDPLTSVALRHGAGGVSDDAVNHFPQYVDDVAAMMSTNGVSMQVAGRLQALRATPHAQSAPDLWLLGSSDFSAQLAAARGLPYVFAHHFAGRGTAEALALYRDGYQPSERWPEPRTFLTVNAVVAETQEEADRRALPNLLTMVALRTGAPLGPQPTIEDAVAQGLPDEHRALADQMSARWVVGTPQAAAEQLAELATTFAVDEVMVHPVAGAYADTPADRSPHREETLRLLTDALSARPV
jgi:luciferase family oxidoreductase group 1